MVLVHAGQQDGHFARALEAEHIGLLRAHITITVQYSTVHVHSADDDVQYIEDRSRAHRSRAYACTHVEDGHHVAPAVLLVRVLLERLAGVVNRELGAHEVRAARTSRAVDSTVSAVRGGGGELSFDRDTTVRDGARVGGMGRWLLYSAVLYCTSTA